MGGRGGWRFHTLTSPRSDLSSPPHQSLDGSSAEDLEARAQNSPSSFLAASVLTPQVPVLVSTCQLIAAHCS